MRDVSIIGIGQTAVGEHWEKSLKDLAAEAILGAISDAQVEHVDALRRDLGEGASLIGHIEKAKPNEAQVQLLGL